MAIHNTSKINRDCKKGKSDYTPISNSILQSSTLTPNEKSIIVHLLSLPKTFAILKTNIWKKMNIGRDAFNKAWKGLEKAGYIKSNRIMENGLLKGWHHIVNETPTYGNSDTLNFSNSEFQIVGKSVSIKKKELIKEVVNKRSIEEKNTSNSVPGNIVPDNALILNNTSFKGRFAKPLSKQELNYVANELDEILK
jgi:hypothetical protein